MEDKTKCVVDQKLLLSTGIPEKWIIHNEYPFFICFFYEIPLDKITLNFRIYRNTNHDFLSFWTELKENFNPVNEILIQLKGYVDAKKIQLDEYETDSLDIFNAYTTQINKIIDEIRRKK